MSNSELAQRVEQVICSHIGVDTSMIFERTKKGACVKARHLSMFILHTLYHISIRELSLRYNISVRHTFCSIARIRDYIKYSKSYRDLLNNIVHDLNLEQITK